MNVYQRDVLVLGAIAVIVMFFTTGISLSHLALVLAVTGLVYVALKGARFDTTDGARFRKQRRRVYLILCIGGLLFGLQYFWPTRSPRSYGNPVSVAEQFMDLYYKQGKPQEAKALATPEAAQQIDEVLESAGEKATGRKVSYILKEKTQEGGPSYALFQLTITRKDAEPLYKTTSLFIDLVDGAWTVTLFDESE